MSPDCDAAVERLDLSLGTYVALKGRKWTLSLICW